MKEIVFVTRIILEETQYTSDELGKETTSEIVLQRIESAMESIGYNSERKLSEQ